MSFVLNRHYEILTPDGFRSFVGLHCIQQSTISVFTRSGRILTGSAKHRILTPNGFTILGNLIVGDYVQTLFGLDCVERLTSYEEITNLYDPIDVDHPEQAFYTDEIISHNCSFMGSANTLIPAHKLAMLGYKEPIETRGDLKIYTRPVKATDEGPSHVYQITVDIGMGQGLDYSVINVTDISENPFRQVAIWRNNSLSATMLAPIIRDIGQYYNNAFVMMEINLEGHAVAEMLHNELEYPGVMTVTPHPKKGQHLSGGFGLKSRFGLKMSEATKRIGCSGLKTLFEQDKYIVNDYQTLRELTTFVVHNKTYQAEVGNHDDIVMTLVLLGWLTLQLRYEDYVGLSMRKLLMDRGETLTFDTPALGHMGDLEQTPVVGLTQGGIEIIDDPDFWREQEDTSWL
jgi:hypothetical protein